MEVSTGDQAMKAGDVASDDASEQSEKEVQNSDQNVPSSNDMPSIVRSASNPIRDGPYMKSPINLWNCPRVVCEHFPNFLGPNTHRNGFFYGR